MKILAFDIALRNNGVCVLDNKQVVYHTRFQPLAEDFYHPMFLKEHLDNLKSLIDKYHPDLIAIEGSSFGSSNWQFSIGALTGVIQCHLYEKEIPVLILPPMKWKKIFTGRGDATKQKIREVSQKLFEFHPEGKHRVSQDEYDASGIAYVAYLALKYKAGKIKKLPAGWKKILEEPGKGILTDYYLSFNLDKLKLSSMNF